jgi:uncharacterized membrane protein YuzA (DUF378 family)
MKDFGLLQWAAYLVIILGGLNLGLMGLLNINMFSVFFGTGFLERLIYVIVGTSSGYLLYSFFKKKPA